MTVITIIVTTER